VGARRGEPRAWLTDMLGRPPIDDCIDWPFATVPDGYGKIGVGGRTVIVAVLVCESVHGNRPTAKHEVAHSCGRRVCVNPRHVRWATHAENMADRVQHGTVVSAKGERHWKARLTEADVAEIRRRCAAGERQADVGATFGLSPQYVSLIALRKRWT
jgi:hypothetical protein